MGCGAGRGAGPPAASQSGVAHAAGLGRAQARAAPQLMPPQRQDGGGRGGGQPSPLPRAPTGPPAIGRRRRAPPQPRAGRGPGGAPPRPGTGVAAPAGGAPLCARARAPCAAAAARPRFARPRRAHSVVPAPRSFPRPPAPPSTRRARPHRPRGPPCSTGAAPSRWGPGPPDAPARAAGARSAGGGGGRRESLSARSTAGAARPGARRAASTAFVPAPPRFHTRARAAAAVVQSRPVRPARSGRCQLRHRRRSKTAPLQTQKHRASGVARPQRAPGADRPAGPASPGPPQRAAGAGGGRPMQRGTLSAGTAGRGAAG
jgi:hypothetical protein